ncbi:MAG: penicillin-binding protein 2 [Chloroflexota bacterium]
MDITQQHQNRIIVMMAVLSAAGLVLVAQLIRWQVVEHQTFVVLAEKQNQKEIIIPARRGNIYDRNQHLLAGNTIQYEVAVSPQIINDREHTADRLYRLLNIPRQDLLEILSDEGVWVPLTRNVPREIGETLIEWDITGLILNAQSKRAYPETLLASHLIGFVNDNNNGFYGIEGYYDSWLRGSSGLQAGEHGPFGDIIPLGAFEVTPASPGADLYLTINRNIQQTVAEELEFAINRYGAESGTIVVLEPKTGVILASVSLPNYDPNRFADSDITHFSDPVVSWAYEPGSVFKIVTMAAGLDSETVTPGTTVYDNGVIEIGGQTIYNSDRLAHGTIDLTTVLAKSLNVATSQVAIVMGPDKFYNYVRRFGFGRLTEVDLAGEGPGFLKTPSDLAWHESDLATNSFGQGIAVTPIQMAASVAAVANDGLLMKPYVVEKVVNHTENRVINLKPHVVRRAVSADTANVLTQMLATALEAEESQAIIPGYRVAGKTGTAQIPIPGGYHPSLTITSFVGYFPIDDPQVLALVILNKPTVSKWGNKTAAPTFRRVGERLIALLDIPPDEIRLVQR